MQQELSVSNTEAIFPHRNPNAELTINFAKGEMMNSWPNEALAECHRRRIIEEMEQIHLEKLALKARVYRPRAFERAMSNFGNWMISAGQKLRKRYGIHRKETAY